MAKLRSRGSRVLSMIVLLATSCAAGALAAASAEFQVNTWTAGGQNSAAVAADARGGFVVVWVSDGPYPLESYGKSIQGRRYRPDGTPVGPQFPISQHAGWIDCRTPDVAMDAEGGFVVAWAAGDEDDAEIFARRFRADGAPRGSQFQVNDRTDCLQYEPAIAVSPAGDALVTWESGVRSGFHEPYCDDPEFLSQTVRARLLPAGGLPAGPEMLLSDPVHSALFPAAADDPRGGFLVVWEVSEGVQEGFSARRIGADGGLDGETFELPVTTRRHRPKIALGGENLVLAWEKWGDTIDRPEIRGRRYSLDGAARGPAFAVNQLTGDAQWDPAVDVDARGAFAITWTSRGSLDTDHDRESIQRRRYRRDGTPLIEQRQVNVTTKLGQTGADVAVDPAGNLVVVWTSSSSRGSDASSWSVQARRFDDLFRDGFESGDVRSWSRRLLE
jgi:hypothetical protein